MAEEGYDLIRNMRQTFERLRQSYMRLQHSKGLKHLGNLLFSKQQLAMFESAISKQTPCCTWVYTLTCNLLFRIK